MTKQVSSNVSPFANAATDLNAGRAYEASGTARLVMGLVGWLAEGRTFLATVKSGTTTESHSFTVTDYFTPVFKPDGKRCMKTTSARMDAMIDAMALPEGINPDAIRRNVPLYLPAAIMLWQCAPKAALKFEGKLATIVGVPVKIALDSVLLDDKGGWTKLGKDILAGVMDMASQNGDEIDEKEASLRLDKATCALSGKETRAYGKLPSVAEFNKAAREYCISWGYMPEPQKRAPRTDATAADAETFIKSVAFLTAKMKEQTEGDEATVGLTKERVEELRTLSRVLADFLAGEE